jgi:hypothetical protein
MLVGWKSPDGTVEAQKFVIVDEAGKKHGFFGLGPKGVAGLILYDADEKPRVGVHVVRNGVGGLFVLDKQGADCVFLGTNEDEVPMMGLYGKESESRALMSVDRGLPRLAMYGPGGKSGCILGAAPSGAVGMGFVGKDGKVTRAGLGVTEANSGWVGVFDAAGNQIFGKP